MHLWHLPLPNDLQPHTSPSWLCDDDRCDGSEPRTRCHAQNDLETLGEFIAKVFQDPVEAQRKYGFSIPTAKNIKTYCQRRGTVFPTPLFFNGGAKVEELLNLAIQSVINVTGDELMQCVIEDSVVHGSNGCVQLPPKSERGSTSRRQQAGSGRSAEGVLALPPAACDRDFLWYELPALLYDDGFTPAAYGAGGLMMDVGRDGGIGDEYHFEDDEYDSYDEYDPNNFGYSKCGYGGTDSGYGVD